MPPSRAEVSVEKTDQSLQKVLHWALERMKKTGFAIRSRVFLAVDPNLSIMGYTKKRGDVQCVVIADWALDSEMLGGLVLHELSHIYCIERGSSSHKPEIVEEILTEVRDTEGLSEREFEALSEAFNHLQNIIVDDIVFAAMSTNEVKLAQRFFLGWVSDRRTGSTSADTASLMRNAFAVASLRRRGLYEEHGEMDARNREFLSGLGKLERKKFDSVVRFLEDAKFEWSEREFRKALSSYLDKVLSLIRGMTRLEDLR